MTRPGTIYYLKMGKKVPFEEKGVKREMPKIQRIILLCGGILILICLIAIPEYWTKGDYVSNTMVSGAKHHYDWEVFLFDALIIGVVTGITFFAEKFFGIVTAIVSFAEKSFRKYRGLP